MSSISMLIGAVNSKLIPILILVLYVFMMIGVAFYSRKRSKSLKDFMLAGEGLGGWMSAFAYGTTYFSSVIFIGYAGKFGWTMGLAVVWIGIGNALIGALLAWKVLGVRTKNMTTILSTRTMPEFFEKRYGDNKLKLLSAIVIFTFLIPYSASVYQGLGYLFETVMGIDATYCIVLMASLTAIYLFFGGYFATALSDFIQGIIMLVGVIIMVVFVLNRPEVNWMDGIKNLQDQGLGFIASGKGGWDSPLFNVIVLILLTSFGIWGLPQSVHKFYAIKNKKAINKAMIISTIFCGIIGCGAYFVGAFGKLFMSEVPQGNFDMIIPLMLEKALPSALLGLIVVLVLSASMSTLASLSMAGASSVAVDAYKGFINKNATDKQVNIRMKLLCLFFVLLSVVLAVVKIDAIVTLMSLSWGVLAGCFLGPYVLGLYSKKMTKQGAYASIICCLLVTFILVFVFGAISPAKNQSGFMAIVKGGIARSPLIGVITMILSMIITPIVSLLTKKSIPKDVDSMFEKVI